MAFRLQTERSYWWPVKLQLVLENGEVEEFVTRVKFKQLSREQFADVFQKDKQRLESEVADTIAAALMQMVNHGIAADDRADFESALNARVAALIDANKAEKPQSEIVDSDMRLVMAIAEDWQDVEINESSEFNAENVRALINYCNGAAQSIVDAFIESRAGNLAITKNS